MPIPSSFTDLDTNPNNNSPQGSENVGPNANGYIQALGAFIKQIYNGSLNPAATVDFNAQKITNIANGSVTSSSKDAITGAQARSLAYKLGEVRMWHGAVANIASVWGAGWQLADGTNGTADLRDRFIVGAGSLYPTNATGGAATVALATANLPSHNHGVNDPGHTHAITQTPHGHAVNDPGHNHGSDVGGFIGPLTGSGTVGAGGTVGSVASTQANLTGITIQPQIANVSNNSAATGITTQNTGSGTAHENRPPYYALCFIEYTGIGA
jgi:microcystin-dependent protein